MRRMVPETQATLRGMINSNPSRDTRVTNSEFEDPDMVDACLRSWKKLAEVERKSLLKVGGWSVRKLPVTQFRCRALLEVKTALDHSRNGSFDSLDSLSGANIVSSCPIETDQYM